MKITAVYMELGDEGIDLVLDSVSYDRADPDGWRSLCLADPDPSGTFHIEGTRRTIRATLKAALLLADLDEADTMVSVRWDDSGEMSTVVTKLPPLGDEFK